MASPPFDIAATSPQATDLISLHPADEQTYRDVVESWFLLLSTNSGVLRADAMPALFEAMEITDGIIINASNGTADTFLQFRDELDVLQALVKWDESEDNLQLIMYADDGVTPRGTLKIGGDSDTFTYNASEVIRANSALATAIVGTGALNAGSITSGFGAIDIGTDTLTAGNTTITGTGSFSGVLSALSTIEIGHATDTTLSRAAAGFLAVEGKRVPSPASQAEGDILYRGATEWERLAKGTANQRLRMNSGATALEWTSEGLVTPGTVQATTSGTTKDFVIPSWATEIDVLFAGVSFDDGSEVMVQIGDAGGIESAGYVSSVSDSGSSQDETTGFIASLGANAGDTVSGVMSLRLLNPATFLWVESSGVVRTTAGQAGGGQKALTAALTTVRITGTLGGTFDAGSVNVHVRG